MPASKKIVVPKMSKLKPEKKQTLMFGKTYSQAIDSCQTPLNPRDSLVQNVDPALTNYRPDSITANSTAGIKKRS